MSSSTVAVATNFIGSAVVPLKSNVRLGDRRAAERALERLDVGELVVAHGRREGEQVARQGALLTAST